jgi:hypothetical protein
MIKSPFIDCPRPLVTPRNCGHQARTFAAVQRAVNGRPPTLRPQHIEWVSAPDSTVLLLSLRRVENEVAFCAQYEFEDVISSVLDADMAAPRTLRPMVLPRRAYKLVRYLSGSRGLAAGAVALLLQPLLDKDYDLFLPIFSHPHQLFALSYIPDWRKRCRKAVCYVAEAWAHLLPGYPTLPEPFATPHLVAAQSALFYLRALALLRHESSRRASKDSAYAGTSDGADRAVARGLLAEPGRSSVSPKSRFAPGCSPRPTRFAGLTR